MQFHYNGAACDSLSTVSLFCSLASLLHYNIDVAKAFNLYFTVTFTRIPINHQTLR